LDSESEALIQDGLRSLRRGRTTFVIAHRLSTIRSADQILVLEAGEIVERGTHDELLAKDGRYRQLYDKQYRFERDRFINPGEDRVMTYKQAAEFQLRGAGRLLTIERHFAAAVKVVRLGNDFDRTILIAGGNHGADDQIRRSNGDRRRDTHLQAFGATETERT